ncbi:MAG: efflux RND transporter periplasmic adaptor subunit [Planctomycetaceae bacterium]
MNPSNSIPPSEVVDSGSTLEALPSPESQAIKEESSFPDATRHETRRWWIKLVLQPLLFLGCGAVLLTGLGFSQRMGWITSGGGGNVHNHSASANADTTYICPMMCTPPQKEPGRCPVCAMELVPAAAGGAKSDGRSIQLDPAARRVANIQTVAVRSMPMTRTIRSVGRLSYDEGTLKTISGYVDGRIEKLYADYTGVVVNQGDHLALVYSPRLYSAQVELLLARRAREESRTTTLARVAESNLELYDSARQRVIELGMTAQQVDELERSGKADSRLHLCAPISGTVIEKRATEGQYVKEGDVIYQLADLSTLWLMLELYPEDAAVIRYGQKVLAEVQSQPGRHVEGRVAFIDPNVDPKTRTVGVRVVLANASGSLRVGDYAKAVIDIPLVGGEGLIYDPELANRWVSPRHPQIVVDGPGKCPICGIDLVPANELGFTDNADMSADVLVVPRNAVLMAGNNSVVYVETDPGRFEIRRVVLGPHCGDQIVIRQGLIGGEQVATRGNFLIDSQMQLAGNPSLIDPTRAIPGTHMELTPVMLAALQALPAEDRQIADVQRICPVTDLLLGAMGTPLRVEVLGQTILICCSGCEERLRKDPTKYLMKLASHDHGAASSLGDEAAITLALAGLSPDDLKLVEAQDICPVAEYRLGTMGTPIKVDMDGHPVFICCEGCRDALLQSPEKYLAVLSAPRRPPEDDGVPPMGDFQMEMTPAEDFSAPPAGEFNLPGSEETEPPLDAPSPTAGRSAPGEAGVVR